MQNTSRKLSLTAIAGEIEHLADNAYTPNESWVIALKINLRAIAATLRDGDEHYCACPTPGAEPGHRCLNCELWVAALAKQAQPLTDEQIRRKAHDWNPDASHAFSEGAKWARDRMAQQAQPECKHGVESYCCRSVRSELCVHDVPAQQAQPEYEKESDAARESADGTSARRMAKWGESQPEMPTREMVGEVIYTALYGHQGGVWRAVETREVWYNIADAVLALFARKDEIIPQNWTPNGLTQEDRDERDAGRIPGSAFRSSLHDDR